MLNHTPCETLVGGPCATAMAKPKPVTMLVPCHWSMEGIAARMAEAESLSLGCSYSVLSVYVPGVFHSPYTKWFRLEPFQALCRQANLGLLLLFAWSCFKCIAASTVAMLTSTHIVSHANGDCATCCKMCWAQGESPPSHVPNTSLPVVSETWASDKSSTGFGIQLRLGREFLENGAFVLPSETASYG